MPIATINPATGETVRIFVSLSENELEAKLALAETTFQRHRQSSFAERAEKMIAAAEILENEQDRLARLMTLEMGKPLQQARAEAAKCATACRYYAAHAERLLADEPLPEADGRCFVRFEPLGVVLAVMPWNFPFWQVVRFAAPALMAGNVGLLKHAGNVPQCALALEELFLRAGFAEGCFQYLAIESKTVQRVIEDSRVAAVTLTGSVAAGSAVASIAGKQIKRSVLELGGSDPFVVMPSAPLAATVGQAVKARVQNNGQSCIAAKRFIVHTAIYDEFEKLFVAAFRRLRVGDPLLPETDIGPLAQAQAVETLERQVQAGIDSGARVLVGGNRVPGPGFFFEPTILTGIPTEGSFCCEELFGPVAMLFRARDLDEALKVANRTPFGLGASIWTQDEAEQQRGIRELQAGQVFVNGIVASQAALPFGGIKQSGYGRELGEFGIREFVNVKSVRIAVKDGGDCNS
ncbi:MAG TPA: NAD-dependent succinate-semialdehyde dehydrogenase [Candidatus Methylacidiphilales bacterium]|jgi:succinate-semialdehyde dehydrogenase/glutarate-semialdehyde dehydrogenase|nr:NAD-dependent succinate-semialdehyde dehydrogenase [Candidatus Methylacidiphilales bacterium]